MFFLPLDIYQLLYSKEYQTKNNQEYNVSSFSAFVKVLRYQMLTLEIKFLFTISTLKSICFSKYKQILLLFSTIQYQLILIIVVIYFLMFDDFRSFNTYRDTVNSLC